MERPNIDDLKEELLLDIQCVTPENITLNPAEQRIVETVTRVLTGAVVMWFSMNQLASEVAQYRTLRRGHKSPEAS